jgi:uncharacterized protein
MVWPIFMTALGLVFVFEGILPFMSPRFWRGLMQQLFLQNDSALRMMGFLSMLIGLALVCLARQIW